MTRGLHHSVTCVAIHLLPGKEDYPLVPESANVFPMAKKASNPGTMSAALGKQIAYAMIDAGIGTNTELAQLTGLSKQTVGRILSGTRDTGVEEYVLICKALGKSFVEMIAAAEQALEASEED